MLSTKNTRERTPWYFKSNIKLGRLASKEVFSSF